MSAFLLSVHVLAAVLTIGPVAIAASMFPRSARLVLAAREHPRDAVAVRILHRITRVYAVIGVLVPVFGIATGASIGMLGDTWLIVSMILTALAAAMLIAFILPGQKHVIRALDVGEALPDRGGGDCGVRLDHRVDVAVQASLPNRNGGTAASRHTDPKWSRRNHEVLHFPRPARS